MDQDILQQLLKQEEQARLVAKAERDAQLAALQSGRGAIDTRAAAGFLDQMYGTNSMAGAQAAAEAANKEQDLLQTLLKEKREPESVQGIASLLRAGKAPQGSGIKPPPGFRFLEDGSLEAIPGGPAAIKAKEAADKEDRGRKVIERMGQTVLRDVTTAIQNLDKYGRFVSGPGGVLQHIPGTQAKQLQADIQSIKSNVGVDQLLEIKRQGSGLGQVPQSQLDMLASLLGGLDQTQDPQKLKENLKDIGIIYKDIIESEGGDSMALVRERGLPTDVVQRRNLPAAAPSQLPSTESVKETIQKKNPFR